MILRYTVPDQTTDLVFTRAFREGSVLFNFDADFNTSRPSASPFHRDRAPAVILGIITDTWLASTEAASQENVLHALESRYESSRDGTLCRLVVVGGQSQVASSNSIVSLRDLEHDTVHALLKDIASALIAKFRTLSADLAGRDSHDAPRPANTTSQLNDGRERPDGDQSHEPPMQQPQAASANSTSDQVCEPCLPSRSCGSLSKLQCSLIWPERVITLLLWVSSISKLDRGSMLCGG